MISWFPVAEEKRKKKPIDRLFLEMARAFGTFLGVKQSSHLSVGYRLAFLVTGHLLFQIALLSHTQTLCFIIIVRVGSGKTGKQQPGPSSLPSPSLSKIPNPFDSVKNRGFRVRFSFEIFQFEIFVAEIF